MVAPRTMEWYFSFYARTKRRRPGDVEEEIPMVAPRKGGQFEDHFKSQ